MTQTGDASDIGDVRVTKGDRTFLLTDGDVPEPNEAPLGPSHRDT